MSLFLEVTWKTATWLAFNLGAQALPMFFLWLRSGEQSKAFWTYFNCTLAALIAVGMLFAAISDLFTERGHLSRWLWGALTVIVLIAIAYLHRVVHDEFLKIAKPDLYLFIESLVFSSAVIVVGAILKMKMWYDEALNKLTRNSRSREEV